MNWRYRKDRPEPVDYVECPVPSGSGLSTRCGDKVRIKNHGGLLDLCCSHGHRFVASKHQIRRGLL